MVHRWGYTPQSLADLMQAVGLEQAHQEPAQYKLREPRDMRVVATNMSTLLAPGTVSATGESVPRGLAQAVNPSSTASAVARAARCIPLTRRRSASLVPLMNLLLPSSHPRLSWMVPVPQDHPCR